jgi:hypothetical protein
LQSTDRIAGALNFWVRDETRWNHSAMAVDGNLEALGIKSF